MIFEKDHLYMRRAFQLAVKGMGKVTPNPLVGSVIVKDDQIIGEGFHEVYGGPHAEVNAINSVENKELLKGAVIYVNLEPCSHFGKTPPCAELIIKYPFKRVVVSNVDPNPLVSGKGIQKIKEGGIEVTENVLQGEGEELNKRFFTFMKNQRPYLILKWAETEDGFIAREDYSSKWISNELSRKLVHKWRAEEDAVMVGTKTALCDNPKLNVREWSGENPVRIFIDKDLKVPANFHLLDKTQKTICYNAVKSYEEDNLVFVKSDFPDIMDSIMRDLYQRKIQSLIVEGGTRLLNEFIQREWWDEIRVFKSEVMFEKGIKAPAIKGVLAHSENVGSDVLRFYKKYKL